MKALAIDFQFNVCCSCNTSIVKSAKTAALTTWQYIPQKIKQQQLSAKLSPQILEISFISPQAMRKLNKKYRDKDYPTDVLSFSHENEPDFKSPIIGEVLICIATAKRQAKESKVSVKHEVQMLTIHGILHVFGYDHETTEDEAKVMFKLQSKIINNIR